MRPIEFVIPGYEVPATGTGKAARPARIIAEQRIAVAPEAIVAIEAPDEPGEAVRVRTATHYWDVGGTYEEAVALWLAALDGWPALPA